MLETELTSRAGDSDPCPLFAPQPGTLELESWTETTGTGVGLCFILSASRYSRSLAFRQQMKTSTCPPVAACLLEVERAGHLAVTLCWLSQRSTVGHCTLSAGGPVLDCSDRFAYGRGIQWRRSDLLPAMTHLFCLSRLRLSLWTRGRLTI